MLHSKRNSLGGRKVSPPQPTCMNPDQKASYLADLRNNRPARPSGSRPLPSRPLPTPNEEIPSRAGSALSFRPPINVQDEERSTSREQKLTHRASMPVSGSLGSLASQKGRPLVPSPSTMSSSRRKVSPPSATFEDVVYRESSPRVKERQEAHALRQALEKIDQGDEERIHNAAKQEAADLVWRHLNPKLAEVEKTAAYRNPDLDKQKYGELGQNKAGSGSAAAGAKPNSRSASGESFTSIESKRPRLPWLRKHPKEETVVPQAKKAASEHENIVSKVVRKASGNRKTSSGSSKGVFRNPEDEIYEEAEEMPTIQETPKHALPLGSRESNALPRGMRPIPEKSHTDPLPGTTRPNRVEIWKNSPTQSRDAGYTASRALPQTPVKELEIEDSDSPRYKDGIEIRGDDIRAATSMKKGDRSPNLPTPTAVSDRLGRPIVSFDPKWKVSSNSPRTSLDIERQQPRKEDGSVAYPIKPKPSVPEITIMEDPQSPALRKEAHGTPRDQSPAPPSIVVPEINLPDQVLQPASSTPPIPRISLYSDHAHQHSVPPIRIQPEQTRTQHPPRINMSNGHARPLPPHTQSAPSKVPTSRTSASDLASRVPWLAKTPTSVPMSNVTCTACTLPIAGRIVTASGSATKTQKARFHPECFTCYHCSTGLECVSFYPEPETARAERYQAAMPHLHPEDEEVQDWVRSNEDLHFFCHLDYHELFSPRCHNCKTPIEGAIVLALGRHYHQDHFFCAECGDPFTSESPFVEHNNYPYCVSCHTKRTSARCRACKQPILNEMTVEALGAKWHDACFVCCECGGDFGEDGRFFVREIEIELTEKEKRKGYGLKIEEKAACQECEERRVKNVELFL